jgi:hypothetical protein
MVLTEDAAKDAYDTVRALAREMLKLLVPSVQTDRISFKPLEDENARRAMHANLWKSTRPLDQPSIRLLIRTIVTELLKQNGFVLYHIDGDRPWAEHALSDNVRQFHERMIPPIKAALRHELGKQQVSESTQAERLKRLRLLVPFYSIEAWLYQNTREAIRLCVEEGCGQCSPKLEAWRQSRASLDEVPQPKETLCLRDRHNEHLARSGFPSIEVFEAGASFSHAVTNLLDCTELLDALERTSAPAPS